MVAGPNQGLHSFEEFPEKIHGILFTGDGLDKLVTSQLRTLSAIADSLGAELELLDTPPQPPSAPALITYSSSASKTSQEILEVANPALSLAEITVSVRTLVNLEDAGGVKKAIEEKLRTADISGEVETTTILSFRQASAQTEMATPPEQAQLDKLLDTDIRPFIASTSSKRAGSFVINALQNASITTVRDILVTGSRRLLNLPHMGTSTLKIIAQILKADIPSLPFPWKESPSMAEIAQYCSTLKQLPGVLLSDHPHYPHHYKMTIEETLLVPDSELYLGDPYASSDASVVTPELRYAAYQIALSFFTAQAAAAK